MIKQKTSPIPVKRYRRVEVTTYDCPVCKGFAGDSLKEARKHIEIPLDTPLSKGFVYFGLEGGYFLGEPELSYFVILNDEVNTPRKNQSKKSSKGIVSTGEYRKWNQQDYKYRTYHLEHLIHGIEQPYVNITGVFSIFDSGTLKNIKTLKNHLSKRIKQEKEHYTINGAGLEIEYFSRDNNSNFTENFPRENSQKIKLDIRDYKKLYRLPRILHPEEFKLVQKMWNQAIKKLKKGSPKKFEMMKQIHLIRTTPELEKIIKINMKQS